MLENEAFRECVFEDERKDEFEDGCVTSRETLGIGIALAVPLIDRELGFADRSSPPRAFIVLRFNGFVGGGMDDERALISDALISASPPGGTIRLGGRGCDGDCLTQEVSVTS